MSDLREVLVQGGPRGLNQQITAGGHHLLADEPLDLGGTDTGANPYDLLIASLGACTSITLRLYADRKAYPLKGIQVRLRHQKIHAQDCKTCETKGGKIDRIEREIKLEGPLSEEQRQRLLQIADRCPVSLTLRSEVHIESRIVEAFTDSIT
ncbi:MAG: OsmC family protein [Deltaproteobacteria bacterium]|nr:OsmC family protein [Deltaproteobacteria bacterium]